MSINISVHGSPFAVRKQYGYLTKTFDSIATSNRQNEFQKRRLIRLQQVREQSKQNSIALRKKVENERTRLLSSIERKGTEDFRRWQSRKLNDLQKQYNECGQETVAEIISEENDNFNDCNNKENERDSSKDKRRGEIALQQVRRMNAAADRKIEEAVERKRLVRNIENLRSSLVTKIQAKNVTDKAKVSIKSPAKKVPIVAKRTVTITKPWKNDGHVTAAKVGAKIPKPLQSQMPDSDVEKPRKTIQTVIFSEPELSEFRPELDSDREMIGHCYCRCPKSPARPATIASVQKIDRALSPIQPNRNTVESQTVAQCCCMCRKHIEPSRNRTGPQRPAMRKNPVPVPVAITKRIEQLAVPKRAAVPAPVRARKQSKPPVPDRAKNEMPDDDVVALLRRVHEQKQRLLDDAVRLPENSNLERVLDGLAELVSNRVGSLPAVTKPVKVAKSNQTQPKIQFKSIAAQTSFSSSTTSSIVAATDSDVVMPSNNQRFVNKSAQVSCEYQAGGGAGAATATATHQNQKIIKIDQMTDVCEIVIRVRDDKRAVIDLGAAQGDQQAEKSRRVVRKKIYRHVSSIISSETTTASSCGSGSSSSITTTTESVVSQRQQKPSLVHRSKTQKTKTAATAAAAATVTINPKLAGYIQKLLKMPKNRIDQLSSCSEDNSGREKDQTMRLIDKAITVKETEFRNNDNGTNEKYKELIEGCSKRIANLDREIEKVRLEKSRILLAESSMSSAGESSSNDTTGLNQSTQYYDPPKFTAPEPKTSSFLPKKETKPPVSLLNTKHQLLNVIDVVEAHELSAIAEVVDASVGGGQSHEQPVAAADDSITSESFDSVFRSLGIEWVLPRLRQEREQERQTKALVTSSTTTSSSSPSPSTSNDDSLHKLIHRILNSISSSSAASSKELEEVAVTGGNGQSDSNNNKQRTSTPVLQRNDDFDYRTFFAIDDNKDGNSSGNERRDSDDEDSGNRELSSIRTVSANREADEDGGRDGIGQK